MSRFRRLSHTAKDRYNEGVQYEPQESDLSFQTMTPEPAKSVTLPVASYQNPIRVGSLIKGMQKADEEGRKLREAVKKKRLEQSRVIKLNMMKLQDKDFKLKGNVFNLAIGEIIDRQAYLSRLNDEITDLKSRISAIQDQQRGSQFEKRHSSVLEKNRTIEERKSQCGRIYSRLQTPESQRKYMKFRNKQIEPSSYFKWKPGVEENTHKDMDPIETKKQTEKSFASYRVKQISAKASIPSEKSAKVATPSKDELILQSSKKTKTDNQAELNVGTKAENNPELKISVEQENKPYSEIVFPTSSQDCIQSINDDFRAKISRQLQIPSNFPLEGPQMGLTIEEYESVGQKIYQVFRINLQREPNKMITRRFKNGVYFQLGGNKNILWYFNGSFYLGGWDTNLPTEGQKIGFGFEYVPEKYFYLGQFKEGMKDGKGSIKMLSGDSVQFMAYEGEWFKGKPHGQGKHIDQKGTKFIGSFVHGEKTGKGTILSKEGILYQGEVQKGIKSGFGVEKLVNGDIYTGQFREGKFDGQGVYKWKNGSKYEGSFVKGKRQGRGKFTSIKGDQFEGEYFDDLKDGWGRFTWANGQIYEGEFKKDIRHGEGTYRHPSGKVGKFMWNQGQIQHRLYSKEEEEYRTRNLKDQNTER